VNSVKLTKFCARRNILCAKKSNPKEDVHLLRKINHLLQKNKFTFNRRYSSFATSSAAEDSVFRCTSKFDEMVEESPMKILGVICVSLKKSHFFLFFGNFNVNHCNLKVKIASKT
jgi:hypothetical protein